jgi:CBS domain-containing protein/GNAT superfamily N-acetyltransferase
MPTTTELRAEGATIHRMPHAFVNKRGEAILVRTLDAKAGEGLVEMYLAFQPRNSFQGLPPVSDQACIGWVRDMIDRAINLVALSFGEGVAGHIALFPMDDEVCELLVVVAPSFQNTGIGTQLTHCAVQLAYEIGFEKIWLPVEASNVRARHVYKKCGFSCLPVQDPHALEMEIDLQRYHAAVNVPVEDAMNRDVVFIGPEASCRSAAKIFVGGNIASLPVVDGKGLLIGILTESDLMLPSNLDRRVREILTHDVLCVPEGTPLSRVVRLFQSRKVRSIPIVDGQGRLTGIIGRKDVLCHFVRTI